MFMKQRFKIVLIIIALVLSPLLVQKVWAQPPPPKPKAIPIDGGLVTLVIAGVAFGAKKLYSQNKNSKSE